MLIYGYKGKCCPTSSSDMHDKNVRAILYYNRDVLNKGTSIDIKGGHSLLLRQVYNTYNTLCKFNNLLVSDNIQDSLSLLNNYLTNNEDVAEQNYDSKIRGIYDTLKIAYNRLSNNIDTLDDIKKKVVASMKFYEKLDLFQVASINQQKNYDDYI
ncbi:MAG: hypothetical protein ACK5HL_04360 [Bacilli bacterium]